MAAKKRPTTKRIVESPAPARQASSAGDGRNAGRAGNGQRSAAGKGSATAKGATGAKGASSASYSPKQAAKARSRSAAVQGPSRRISGAMLGWISGGLALVLVVVVVVIVATGGSSGPANTGRVKVPANIINQVTNVPGSVLDSVGIGGQKASKTSSGANPIAPVPAAQVASAALPPSANKLPTLFYFGAEFCPYCATERWSMIVALSRFGTFSGLQGMSSSATDVVGPSTQTFTFYKSTYTSKYINFVSVEDEDQNGNQLESPTTAQLKVMSKWNPHLSFPFLDLAGKYIGGIPNWLPPALLHGLSRADIAQALSTPGNVAGAPLDANANYLTAAICSVTGQQPAAVCSSTGVTAAAAQFKNLAPATPI